MNDSAVQSAVLRTHGGPRFGDRAFQWLTLLMALSVFALIVLIGWELAQGSRLALHKFGWHFLVSSNWDPVNDEFGALPFIFGTLVSSAIALLIAVPISIATAVYLTELAPLWLRQPLTMFIELLAAIPSVILGLWGIFVMVPWLRDHLFPWLQKHPRLPAVFPRPDLRCQPAGRRHHRRHYDCPYHHVGFARNPALRARIAARSRLRAGATRWEVTRIAVLSYAKKGLFGAVILGLGRALGETWP